MPEGRSRLRRCIPPIALALFVGSIAVDLPRSEAEAPAEAKPKADRAPDIKDTHQRLKRIYERLGIKREEAKPQPRRRSGCTPEESKRRGPLAPKISAPPALPPALGYVLIGVVLVAMLLPILLALRGRHDPTPEGGFEQEDAAEDEVSTPREPWEVNLAACRRLLAAGQLAEAFAGLHRLTLLALQQAGVLVLDSTSTNWDYVRRLISRPPERTLLSQVTIAAESAVLGQRPPDASRFDELERSLRERLEGHLQ